MAGNYTDPPGLRIPYDRNGSQGFLLSGSLSKISLGSLNNDGGGYYYPGNLVNGYRGLVFPIPFTITHYFTYYTGSGGLGAVQWSPDTTNGLDGTWTQISSSHVNHAYLEYREQFTAVGPLVGAQGIRFYNSTGLGSLGVASRALHLYGYVTDPATPRLAMWHPTLNEPLPAAHLDWGDRPQGSSATRQFRIKNFSTTLTATSINVTLEGNPEPSPSWASQHSFRTPAGSGLFYPTITLDSLGPSATSAVIDIKQDISLASTLGIGSQRLIARALEWS